MRFCFQRASFFLIAALSHHAFADVSSGDRTCSCGFYDPATKQVYTESIIVYFNETDTVPSDFIVQDYQHRYEKEWNAVYRQGADPSNVQANLSDALQLSVSPSTDIHLVTGGGIQTVRRDIQHGSFRVFMKGASRRSRGSAMSMIWQYNETESTELSIMNTNNPSQAWVGNFINHGVTGRDLGVNFSTALNSSTLNRNYTVMGGGLENGSVNPWDFTEYRIDWTKDFINFYIGGNNTRSVRHKKHKGMPSVPAPLFFKHWSTGNEFTMQGPPRNRSTAEIAWIRMFF